jgi:hypothetical protein
MYAMACSNLFWIFVSLSMLVACGLQYTVECFLIIQKFGKCVCESFLVTSFSENIESVHEGFFESCFELSV